MNSIPNESAQRVVLALYANGQLGYLRASDEWVGGRTAVPLPEDWQQAAQDLVDDGQLSEFETMTSDDQPEGDAPQ